MAFYSDIARFDMGVSRDDVEHLITDEFTASDLANHLWGKLDERLGDLGLDCETMYYKDEILFDVSAPIRHLDEIVQTSMEIIDEEIKNLSAGQSSAPSPA